VSTNRWRSGWPHGPEPGGPAVLTAKGVHTDATRLRWLCIAAVAEATTLLLLVGVAVPLKHLGDWPLAVRVLGPVHGFAFVAYLWLVLQSLGAGFLSRGEAARLSVSAFLPVAGYLAARFLARRALGRPDRGHAR
jgi:integral membrane protein